MDRYPAPDVTDAARSSERTPATGLEASVLGYSAIGAMIAAAIAWSPATGDVSSMVGIAGLASVALVLVEQSRARARRGPRRLTGRRRTLLLVALGAVVVAGAGGSFATVAVGRGELALAIAAATGSLVLVGIWLSERDPGPTTP